jgi:hypothetical protein
MEGQIQNTQPGGMNKIVIPTVVAALIVLAAVGFYLYNSNSQEGAAMTASEKTGVQSTLPAGSTAAQPASAYKDGTYELNGVYTTPGGQREVGVTLTLANGVITDAEAEVLAEDATSKRFQGEFVNNFEPMVVGKSIDEVSLTKVAGSSLTPKGFNDAVSKIKVEAGA